MQAAATIKYATACVFSLLLKVLFQNKVGYTATLVACGWAGAVMEKVILASGQEM